MRFKPHNGKKRRLEHTFSHRKTSSISLFSRGVIYTARSRFARSTIPEEKWGTIRSLAKTRLTLVFKLHLNLLIHSTKKAVFQ